MNFANFRSNRRKAFSAVIVAAAVIGLSPVQAEDVTPWSHSEQPEALGKTRAQVAAELDEAIRTGDLLDATVGMKLNELYPGSYPATPRAAGKTRAQVQRELDEAIRTGDLLDATVGMKLKELYPGSYPTTSRLEMVGSK